MFLEAPKPFVTCAQRVVYMICENHVFFGAGGGDSTSLDTEVLVTWSRASREVSSLDQVLFPTLCIILSMSLKWTLKKIPSREIS